MVGSVRVRVLGLALASNSTPELTSDDLKKLEIICFVPSYLPQGFRLQRVDITYDEPGPDEANVGFHFTRSSTATIH